MCCLRPVSVLHTYKPGFLGVLECRFTCFRLLWANRFGIGSSGASWHAFGADVLLSAKTFGELPEPSGSFGELRGASGSQVQPRGPTSPHNSKPVGEIAM